MPRSLLLKHAWLPALAAPDAADSLAGADAVLVEAGRLGVADTNGVAAAASPAFRAVAPLLYLHGDLRIAASLAGADPAVAIPTVSERLAEGGCPDLRIGVVQGHDVLDRLEEWMSVGERLAHAETEQPFVELTKPIHAAVVSTGQEALEAALRQDARVVLLQHCRLLAMASAFAAESLGGDSQGPAKRLTDEVAIALRSGQPVDVASENRYQSDATATAGASPTIGSVPVGRCGVDIVYREGYSVDAVIPVGEPSPADAVEARRQTLLSRIEGFTPRAGSASCQLISQARGGPVEAFFLQVHVNDRDAAEAVRLGLEAVQLDAGNAPAPRMTLVHGVWPTSVPWELVEWSVAVRAASDWVDSSL